ncbi:protein cortex isoform X2 [Camponotus floridanus]|nr:protein cortex isoform X2 [Camponotus floridanus]
MKTRIHKLQDIHKQIELLNITHQREAWRALMAEQTIIPDLNQIKILHYSNSTMQSQNLQRTESKEERKWKCTPRKKTLIGNVEKILCLDSSEEDNKVGLIDWSCNGLISFGNQNGISICNRDGIELGMCKEKNAKVVKWSNDGSKLAICTSLRIILYDLEKEKSIWNISSKCLRALPHSNHCICWSFDDRYIVIGCEEAISVYETDTGKLIESIWTIRYMDCISSLNFSPNYKYLVSTDGEQNFGIFTWPDIKFCYYIELSDKIRAVAWHPQMSNTLCIGSGRSLMLWNVNKKTIIDHKSVKSYDFRVENLVWNKLSGELVVHWTYREGNKRYSIVPVLASFDRIVDALPLKHQTHISFLKFNGTHEELITCDNEVFSIWNFFGEKSQYGRQVPLYNSTRQKQGVLNRNPIR